MSHHLLLSTGMSGLTLRRLLPDDAGQLYQLVQANRDHLTAHGDYSELVAASVEDIAADLIAEPHLNWHFGICLEGSLTGRVDLIGVEPPQYGLGYWIGASHTRKGLATEAVRTIVDFAPRERSASDIFAGVTHGNASSVALLSRLDFRPTIRFDTYMRYHRAIS